MNTGISLVAYTITPGQVFVRDPSLRGRWMITDICVVHETCPQCQALVGEPCFRFVQGVRSYSNTIHYARRKRKHYPLPDLGYTPEELVND